MAIFHAKYAFMRIQPDLIMTLYLENQAHKIWMIHSQTRVRSESKVMKREAIAHLKVALMFLRLKGIFQYANIPEGQMKFVLCWSSYLIWILLYP